jgi:molybdopterin converting factor small subunit
VISVLLPSQLTAYSGGASRLTAQGATVDEVLRDLDARYSGIRFRLVDEQDRVRPHMRIFVGRERVTRLSDPLPAGSEVLIFGALSGG